MVRGERRGHQVYAALHPQALTDERGFEQGFFAPDAQDFHRLADVFHLLCRLFAEGVWLEIFAGTEAQGLLAERALQRVGQRGFISVADNVVEGRSCEVTQ